MTDPTPKGPPFVTISMAEILLSQNMIADTRKVVRRLEETEPDNPRVQALVQRLEEVARGESQRANPIPAKGIDRVALTEAESAVVVTLEVTEKGMAIGKRVARYSGRSVVRIFTAAPGPRGVRTVTRDLDVDPGAWTLSLLGMPRPAVHVASVGYLANTGVFVSLAQTAAPLVIG